MSRGKIIIAAILAFAAACVVVVIRKQKNSPPPAKPAAQSTQAEIFARFAGSKTCADCHKAEFDRWQNSHHGLAEREIRPEDLEAFSPAKSIAHGTQKSVALTQDKQPTLQTAGFGGNESFSLSRVIGVSPLRQFLVPGTNGQIQVTELAFDPHLKKWFNIFGDEDRRAGEWGHWTGRGMRWNSMCAACHNTRLRKNYDPSTDTYRTSSVEMGVGCESCHGPMTRHVEWQRKSPGKNDPTISRLTTNQMVSACATCHSRRTDLDGEFEAGNDFFDHYGLTIPDETDLYYADGQVRDENYEFTSFISSRMHGAGVSCSDCHEPHSAKLRFEGDALCMRCHAGPIAPAPKIEPTTHTFHKPGTEGSRCVDCHMPVTTYMQRHPRRDHGFTIPDPLLTKEHGVPNACNRCHKDKSTDWALDHANKWYGEKLNRPTRQRARVIARARKGDAGVLTQLIAMSKQEPLPLWRGAATVLLEPLAPEARDAFVGASRDSSPLVRAQAVRGLTPLLPDSVADSALKSLLNDSSKSVRVAAAWALHNTIDTNSLAGRDLLGSLRFNSDQPLGAMQYGTFLLDRNEPLQALPWFEKAVEWDTNSAPFRQALAIGLSTLNRMKEAIMQLEAACRLAPKEGHYHYSLALALNEAGQKKEAVEALQRAVALNEKDALSWYNLGLGYSGLSNDQKALEALARAEILDERSHRIPYARATVLLRMGQRENARKALDRVLELQPGFAPAHELLRSLTP